MKRLFTLLLVVAMLFVGCSKDDKTANYEASQTDLTGTWKISSKNFEATNIPLNECNSKTSITVDSKGNASWIEFSKNDANECENDTDTFVFTVLNVNFEIKDNSSFNNYYGQFYNKNEIEITEFFDDNNGLKAKTVYRFKKQ